MIGREISFHSSKSRRRSYGQIKGMAKKLLISIILRRQHMLKICMDIIDKYDSPDLQCEISGY